MSGGYGVEPAELRGASGQIEAAASTAEGIQLTYSDAAAYGEGEVHGAMAQFCTTWQMALGVLAARARSASQALEASADHYAAQDAAASQLMCPAEFPELED